MADAGTTKNTIVTERVVTIGAMPWHMVLYMYVYHSYPLLE